MKVFLFDLLAYGEQLEHLKVGTELPYPLPRQHFKSDVAIRSYAEHLAAWEEADRLGFDGIGFNEHHCSPYGLMNSPNLMASAAAQRTKRAKLLIYGNLLPLHEPLRLAEELAMVDCLSGGRLISGFARGIPREYQVHHIPLGESRERFEEAFEIITRAWSEEVFSYEGKFWTYKDVALWPRPAQRPHPPVWIPVTGSKESIEFAAKHGITITPGLRPGGLQEDIVRYYVKCCAKYGRRVTPNHLTISANAYIADSKAQAVKENAPYFLYFNRTLFSHGNFTETSIGQAQGYMSQQSIDYVRPENRHEAERARADYRNMTTDDVARMAERLAWGTPKEVIERITAHVDRVGASTIQVMLNAGAMPQEMYIEQIRRFARDVLPALQAHDVKRVPVAEEELA